MPHFPKPWFRKGRGWYLTLDGNQIPLGNEQGPAFQKYHELMAAPPEAKAAPLPPAEALAPLLDRFVTWVEAHRAPDTFRWYKDRLQAFLEFKTDEFAIKQLAVRELKPFHVQQWIDGMPHKSGTKRNYVRAVKRAMLWCEEQGYLERSPLAHMKKPAGGRRAVPAGADSLAQQVIHTVEQYADGAADRAAFLAARKVVRKAERDALKPTVFLSALMWLTDDAMEALTTAIESIRRLAGPGAGAAECELIRCIFGNPFRPAIEIAPAILHWNDATVVRLAQAIYDERRFEDMPILADALEDAGCADEQVLAHCRGDGPHARGCWLVDLILRND